jgi:hypothetical protein
MNFERELGKAGECLPVQADGIETGEYQLYQRRTWELSAVAQDLEGAAEDWSTSTRILCKACSEGTPGHLHHADHSSPAHPSAGVAARDRGHWDEFLATWSRKTEDSHIHAVHEIPGDAADQGVSADGDSPRR